MRALREATLLRIFVAENDRAGQRPLAEAIVDKAREMGLAGATVFRGSDGFGGSRRFRSELNVDAGPRQPVIIEIVDSPQGIDPFLPVLDQMMDSGLVTIEAVKAIDYGLPHPGFGPQEPPPSGGS